MKTMKTMKSTNKNAVARKRTNRVVVTSMEQACDNVKEKALEAVYNGTIGLKQLLNIKDECIDMKKCENPITVIQKIYSAGSDVGKVTIQGQNMYMIDVTDDKGFEEFKEALVPLNDEGQHTPYESVWIEGYNMFSSFNFKTGQRYVYYVVTNEDIAMLQERIVAMNKSEMTKEDAKALQADLPPFIRAWQESSIDVSKDKDKVFDIKMDAILGRTKTYSQLIKKHKKDIDFNFSAIKTAKEEGKEIPMFVFSNKTVAEIAPIMDLMGHVNVTLQETAEEMLNGKVKELLGLATNDMYKPFVKDTMISKELAYFIDRMYKFIYNNMNEDNNIPKEDFAKFRNVIYTAAAEYGVAAEDVIRVAIATKMSNVNKDKNGNITIKNTDINKFKQYPVANIFPEEYVEIIARTQAEEQNNEEIYDAYKYEYYSPEECICEISRDIEDYEEIEFFDGVSEDGTIKLFDRTFNGVLREEDGIFIYEKGDEIYEYEETHALLSLQTFKEGATTAELSRIKDGDKSAYDKGQFLADKYEALKTATIIGQNANILKTAHNNFNAFLCTFIANYETTKGEVVEVQGARSYKAKNGEQQVFLMFV